MSSPSSSSSGRAVRAAVRVALPAIVLAGAAAFMALMAITRPDAAKTETPGNDLVVRTVVATSVPVTRWWEGYGTARARDAADVLAEVEGIVIERPVATEAGSLVSAGDLLVRLDRRDWDDRLVMTQQAAESLRAELRGLDVQLESLDESISLAEEAVRLTQWELDELDKALGQGGATPIETERLRRELTRARREAQSLREQRDMIPSRRDSLLARLATEEQNGRMITRNIERSEIRAPIDGRLQEVDLDLGERVAVGQRVARIVSETRIEVPVRLPVSAAEIKPGDVAELSRDVRGPCLWRGRVARLSPEADPGSRTLTVYVEVEQDPTTAPAGLLRPGQFVAARVNSAEVMRSIVVPRGAVEGDRVMVIADGGTAQPRSVRVAFHIDAPYAELDERETEWAVIESGLEPGDVVITSNLDDLLTGMKVHAAQRETSAKAGPGAPAGVPGIAERAEP